MVRLAHVGAVLLVLVGSAACSPARIPPALPRARPTAAIATTAPAWGVTAPSPRESAGSAKGEKDESYEAKGRGLPTLWRGGRHPQWRGCQHTYQPAVSAWVFGSAGPSASPPSA